VVLAAAALLGAPGALPAADVCGAEAAEACSPATPDAGAPAAGEDRADGGELTFYWGVGCPHCEEARPYLDALAREHPALRVIAVEIRRDPAGRARYLAEVERLRLAAPGIPLFVAGDAYVLRF
jgi:thiol-disulfide isomerase/thioredoxin